ncbi:MAG TPA: hypothetical protein VEC37_05910, partial [Bacillota bacterium]|nr:hypothetical protein [Bacillota bacterium]
MKTIFFDLDETLFDHRYASQMGLTALRQKYPKLQQIPIVDLETVFWEIVNCYHQDILGGKITREEGRLQRLAALYQQYQLQVPETELVIDALLYRELYQK